jgi:hypothetical protein
MDIKESATYPYPIWGLHNSFLGEAPEVSEKVSVHNFEKNTIEISFEVTTRNAGIDRLIEEGKAKYDCIVKCPPTYFLQHNYSDSPSIKISVPTELVYNRFDIQTVIVATEEIIQCDYLELDEIYDGHADYPKGAVIAYIDDCSVSLKQHNHASDLSKIIKVTKTDVNNVKNIFSESRILIQIPKTHALQYDKAEANFPSTIASSLVFSALVQAFYKLRDDYDDSKDWVFYLRQYVKECNDNDIINLDNDEYILELDDIFAIVNHLLDNPQIAALDEIAGPNHPED